MASSYLSTIRSLLPQDYSSQVDNLDPSATSLFEILLRLSSGAKCPSDAPASLRSQWSDLQIKTSHALERLKTLSATKRAREDDVLKEPDAKKSKSEVDSSSSPDKPLYTLHAISVSSPIRKKVDITVHESSIRFTHPTTKSLELSVPMAHLKRAFLLPTRGKSKPHWTVLIMSLDTPIPSGKAAAAVSAATKEEQPQIVFGVDAGPSQPYSVTVYADSDNTTTKAKNTPILPFLEQFLKYLPFQTLQPSTSVFRSALSTGDGSAGVEGHRGAKSGTLWFLSEGILWDGKPCEFWPLSDLVGGRRNGGKGQADVDLGGAEGVKTVSATGRTCSAIISRKMKGEGEDGEEEAEQSVDTDVMVDGKEQEGIARWVKKHRHLFGVVPAEDGNVSKAPAEEDDDDDNDEDFEGSSSDGGSPTSSSDDEGDDEGGGGEDDASEDLGSGSERSDDAEEEDAEEEPEHDAEEEELDPAHHPLLRPGAMPRMSRAAIDAVVGMVQDDLMGGATSLERRAANDTGESGDEEEDELED